MKAKDVFTEIENQYKGEADVVYVYFWPEDNHISVHPIWECEDSIDDLWLSLARGASTYADSYGEGYVEARVFDFRGRD